MASELPATGEDKRIERLFDYTKWHIGIYLAFGGGLIGLLGSRDGSDFLSNVIKRPTFMLVALFAMGIAGAAGGVVASATTRCNSFEELWTGRPTLFRRRPFTVETWASVEHYAFWASILMVAASIVGWRPQNQPRVESVASEPCCAQVVKCTK